MTHAVCTLADRRTAQLTGPSQHDPEPFSVGPDQMPAFTGRLLLIAIEQSRGPLVHASQGPKGLQLYPLNPKQLARFARPFFPPAEKAIPRDAELARSLPAASITAAQFDPTSPTRRRPADRPVCLRFGAPRRETENPGLRLMDALKLYFPLAP